MFLTCTKEEQIVYVNNNNLQDWSIEEQEFYSLINSYRIDKGLSLFIPAKLNWDLALVRSIDNSIIKDIDHSGYYKVVEARKSAGLNYSVELLGFRYSAPSNMLSAFQRSDDHNDVLIDPTWMYIGISIYTDDINKYYTIILTQ